MSAEERMWQLLRGRHSLEKLREWNRRLSFFRFFRAYGGLANDSDSLDAAISYKGEDDLMEVLAKLGIKPKRFAQCPLHLVRGVSYSGAESERFPSVIAGTQWVAQPGHTTIFGTPAFVWCYEDRILVSPRPNTWDVGEPEVQAAEAMEVHLASLSHRILDPPRDSERYLCAANYPLLGSK